MAKTPYSVEFIKHMVSIIQPDVENLTLMKDVQQLVVNFLSKSFDNILIPIYSSIIST